MRAQHPVVCSLTLQACALLRLPRGWTWETTMLLALIKVIAAAVFALVLWWVISGALTIPSSSPQEPPPRPPVPVPAPAKTTAPPAPATAPQTAAAAPTTTTAPQTAAAAPATAADIAKLNDNIAKLTAAVDKLSQQLAGRDRPARPSSSSPRPPSADTLRRQETYACQTLRRPSWRDQLCEW